MVVGMDRVRLWGAAVLYALALASIPAVIIWLLNSA